MRDHTPEDRCGAANCARKFNLPPYARCSQRAAPKSIVGRQLKTTHHFLGCWPRPEQLRRPPYPLPRECLSRHLRPTPAYSKTPAQDELRAPAPDRCPVTQAATPVPFLHLPRDRGLFFRVGIQRIGLNAVHLPSPHEPVEWQVVSFDIQLDG